MAYIRKVKTASGAIAVQIAYTEHGRVIRIDHIGSSHTETELETLLALARQRLHGSQLSLFKDKNSPLKISLKESVSFLLLQILTEQYNLLGFDQLRMTSLPIYVYSHR